MSMVHGPFDSVAGAFLDAPNPVRAGAVSARRTIALVGSMPSPVGLWLRQVAESHARERGPVCMLRLESDAVQLQLFRATGLRPPMRADASLEEMIRALASIVTNWIVVPASGELAAIPAGATDLLLLSSTDEPAVLAAYTLLKQVAVAPIDGVLRGASPPIAVQMLGSALEECVDAAESLAVTAREYLQLDLRFQGGIHRIAPTEPTLQKIFEGESPRLEQVFDMIRLADSSSNSSARGERFAPRADRVRPRTSAPSNFAAPQLSPSSVPTSAPASMHASTHAATQPFDAAPIPFTVSDAPRCANARGPAPVSAPRIDPMPALTASRATIAPAPAVAFAVPTMPPMPTLPVRARIVDGELPSPFAAEITGLTLLPFRAPREATVELAIDDAGRMHVIGHARLMTALLRVRAWAIEHATILRLAHPALVSVDAPMIDVVITDVREAQPIDGATVYLFTHVEMAGRHGHLVQLIG